MQADQKARRAALRKAIRRERKRLGAVLRAAIADSDLKQVDIARALGMRPNMVSEIVTGRRKTELAEVAAIAKLIHTDVLTLVRRWAEW